MREYERKFLTGETVTIAYGGVNNPGIAGCIEWIDSHSYHRIEFGVRMIRVAGLSNYIVRWFEMMTNNCFKLKEISKD